MMATTNWNAYWLLDATALTAAEREAMCEAPAIRWLYDHIPEDQANMVSPVLVAPCAVVNELAQQLQADEARAWSVARLYTQVDFAALGRHLVALRYLHTRDGQRYYLRYADSRCLTALWPVLTAAQQRTALGPVQRWSYFDRQARPATIDTPSEAHSTVRNGLPSQLRLSDPQLGQLLQRTWPDQLLYSVAEQQPTVGCALTPWQRYECAQRVCDWLLTAQEERYPVQLEMLKLVLSNTSPNIDEDRWSTALRLSHKAALDVCT